MATIDETLMSTLLGVMKKLKKPIEKHISLVGLTTMQFAVMERILHKGECTINEIIESVFSTSGNITVVIENLIKLGLLGKKTNVKDKRSRLIYLTSKGEEKISSYYLDHKNELSRLMGGISADDKQELIDSLTSFKNSIK